jgi:hypothetical protein
MSDQQAVSSSLRIRQLNDQARRTFLGAAIVATAAFQALEPELKARALHRVRTFTDFDTHNDPHFEHDLAFFEVGGEHFFFKFDYFDPSMESASDDPADPNKTRRILTIGLAADY